MAKKLLYIGLAMLAIAIAFVWYAINHPEGSFNSISAETARRLYVIYLVIMALMFLLSFCFYIYKKIKK